MERCDFWKSEAMVAVWRGRSTCQGVLKVLSNQRHMLVSFDADSLARQTSL